MVDLFEEAASSSSASVNLVRCLLGAVGTSTIQLMIDAMGPGWSFTTLAGIIIVSAPLVYYQYRYGSRYRLSRFIRRRITSLSNLPQTVQSSALSALPHIVNSSTLGLFPKDFVPSTEVSNSYSYVDVDLCEHSCLRRVTQMYLSSGHLTLPAFFISAFCATISRITGRDVCSFTLSLNPDDRRTLFLKIDNESLP